MLERTYNYLGYTIEQWKWYGKRTFTTSSFYTEAEFNDIKQICK